MDCTSFGIKSQPVSSTTVIKKTPEPTLVEWKREVTNNLTYTNHRNPVKEHNCRIERLVQLRDKNLWMTWVFAHGMEETASGVCDLYKEREMEERLKHGNYSMTRPDRAIKLLNVIGKKGKGGTDFKYPRAVTFDEDGVLYIADTDNNRIRVYTLSFIHLKTFGEKGSGINEFDCPNGISVKRNFGIAVSEQNNKRVQVFDFDYKYKFDFPTLDEPIAIAIDKNNTIVIATLKTSIEIHSNTGSLISTFNLRKCAPQYKHKMLYMVYIALNNQHEVLVSDPFTSKVTFYTYRGTVLSVFDPCSSSHGMTFVPAGIAIDVHRQIVIADRLNHIINVYNNRGHLIFQYAGPMDQIGAVQALAVSSTGHLAITESSITGPHCVKVFRYAKCECHRYCTGTICRLHPPGIY